MWAGDQSHRISEPPRVSHPTPYHLSHILVLPALIIRAPTTLSAFFLAMDAITTWEKKSQNVLLRDHAKTPAFTPF